MQRGMRRFAVLFMLVIAALLAPVPSHAFCGFYVNTGDQPLFNDATRVVMMRSGMRTVLSIQNDYKGPLESFALVIPVPIILERENVRTLEHSIFERIDRLTSPRLVEYWEQDPCLGANDDAKEGGTGTRAKGEEGSMGKASQKPLVTIERQFSVDEYDIVILSALDSGALEAWLHENKYVIPAAAEPYLRPYVQSGSKFFVAKVNIGRVRFRWNRAHLSPLRFHYDTPELTLPIRLGLINSGGTQDLLVYILGEQRYETANYENLTIPTNLDLKDDVKPKFNSFYAALFDRTLKGHPRAVVTEYAWSPESCDPCPAGAGPLAEEDSRLLGLDVMKPTPSQLVLTRLHARYGKDSIGDDLVFKAAPPIEGGREDRYKGAISHGATTASSNSFQGRYVVRHRWTGPVECARPSHGVWGGPPNGRRDPDPLPNPLAERDLKVDDFIVPDVESSPMGYPVRHEERELDRSTASLIDVVKNVFEGPLGYTITWIVSFVAAGIWARRRRTGVMKTLGLFLAFAVLVLVAGAAAAANRSRFHLDLHIVGHLLRQSAVLLASGVMLAGVAAGGTKARAIWAFLPALGGVFSAGRMWTVIEEGRRGEWSDVDLEQLGRIYAEATAELFEPIIIGAAISGVVAVAALLLHPEKRDGVKWPLVVGAVLIAGGARAAFIESTGPLEVVAAIGFLGAALVVARARSFDSVLGAVAAMALLDVAAKLMVARIGLEASSSESVDGAQVGTILRETLHFENLHLLVAALDLGLLVGLRAMARGPIGFIDWRTASGAVVVVLLCALPFEYFGLRTMMRSLDGRQGSSSTFRGPTLYVLGGGVLATARPDVPPEPYSPRLAEKLAAADTGEPPFLVGESDKPLSSLFAAVAPFLRVRQDDFRLVSMSSPASLGPYAGVVAVRGAHPFEINLLPRLDVVPPRPMPTEAIMLRWDGDRFHVRGIRLQGLTISSRGNKLADDSFPRRWEPDHRSERDDLLSAMSRDKQRAVLVVPAETPLDTVSNLLDDVTRLGGKPLVLSTDVAAFDRL